MRADYLEEPEKIPEFWICAPDDVGRFLDGRIRKGHVRTIGRTAGGRAMRAAFYGKPRRGKGTTTFSGSLGFGDFAAYRGPDNAKTVYMAMGAVHGGEFEGIVGIVNLLAALETGRDLLGNEWPGITAAAAKLDRIVLLPITNVDGRTRIPLRMESFRGSDFTVHEYLNTGGKKDGTLIGWPQCKEHIPLDFSTVGFPGGYPNDNGVNFQHDDFFRAPQPETRALYELTAAERPDVIFNMHTGTQFIQMLNPFVDPGVRGAYRRLYRRVHTKLTLEKLQPTDDVEKQAEPGSRQSWAFNLDSALNMNCGALAVTVEGPAHDYSTGKRNGKPFTHSPADIVRAHLLTHQEAMGFVADSGGRARWSAKKPA